LPIGRVDDRGGQPQHRRGLDPAAEHGLLEEVVEGVGREREAADAEGGGRCGDELVGVSGGQREGGVRQDRPLEDEGLGPAGGVGAHQLEQAELAVACALHERGAHETLQRSEHGSAGHGLGAFGVKARAEHGQLGQQLLLGGVEHLPRAIEHRPQDLLARALAAADQRLGAQDGEPRHSELDG
jgi:hypothetical protein